MNKWFFSALLLLGCMRVQGQRDKDNDSPVKKTIQDSYNSVISKATLSISAGEFERARDYYKKAQELAPAQRYPAKMIHFIDRIIWANNEKQNRDQELQRKAEINRLMKDAVSATLSNNYDTARFLYQQILSLNPAKSQEDFAREKIKAMDAAVAASAGRPHVDKSVGNAISTKSNAVVSGTGATDTKKTKQTTFAEYKSENLMGGAAGKVLDESDKKELSKSNDRGPERVATGNKTNPPASGQKKPDDKLKLKETATVNPSRNISPTRRNASASTAKVLQKKTSLSNFGGNIREQTNVADLMNNATSALNAKKYQEARAIYQKVLSSNCSKAEKEFAKTLIMAIDEEVKKERQKKL